MDNREQYEQTVNTWVSRQMVSHMKVIQTICDMLERNRAQRETSDTLTTMATIQEQSPKRERQNEAELTTEPTINNEIVMAWSPAQEIKPRPKEPARKHSWTKWIETGSHAGNTTDDPTSTRIVSAYETIKKAKK